MTTRIRIDPGTQDRAPKAGPRRAPRHWRLRSELRPVDYTPPPIRGRVGGIPVALYVWPGDVLPPDPLALKPRTGCLAGFWVRVRFL